MQLSALLREMMSLPSAADRDIARLVLDSRRIRPGDLFIAIKGTHVDGRHYIPAAIQQGVAAVLVDANQKDEQVVFQQDIPLIPVYQLSAQLGEIASRFYGDPARRLRLIGVTGTNGKTSCTHFIAQMLETMKVHCGLIGTLGTGFYGRLTETGLTTPDAITLQAVLAEMVKQSAQAAAMEVSSHSIDQGRVNGLSFEIGMFTNLTQDHLDYHGSMDVYAAVKRRFLADMPTKQIIINADDAYGRAWCDELAAVKPVFAYGLKKPRVTNKSIQLIYTENAAFSLQGIKADVHTPWGHGELFLPLIGQFNLSNALAVLTALCVYGMPFEQVLHALSTLCPVPGRMQTLGGKMGQPLVVVDYSHTPDALENALRALRAHTAGKLICVFGCGGDRDPGKRPLMGRIAEQLADKVIVTNDNPRHEQPQAIAAQILRDIQQAKHVFVELDRSKAIRNGIQWATEQDCILVAGKGAERYQQIGDEKFPFDDVEQVKSYLEGS